MILVVGLGNPGPRYAETRHNLGFRVVDEYASRLGAPSWKPKFQGDFCLAEQGGKALVLLKPKTFMNESGRSVQAMLGFYKPELMLVVYDELDLPFGEMRLKFGGGDAGHRGLRSIIGCVGRDFGRLRFGIGRPPPEFRGDVTNFVLEPFSSAERAKLDSSIARATDGIECVVSEGLSAAMNRVNQRPKDRPQS